MKYLYLISNSIGILLIGIALWRFRKTLRRHNIASNDEQLSNDGKKEQNKSIIILLIGVSIIFITQLVIGIFIILK
ncbi:hypothetical protein BKP45_21290 [Anaerobacillus alkalidiazotrophicus]|uniref:Uncharacterized protein n=1 Tax=Anaerobacillus alkalidiazotrophicus TaxID=472963 RepID=A0A1S2LVJ7_9BACI|nr:hypothetical protein BKP45_21290 [Anaerobacillus alkalidiazotrophicus]